MSLRGPEFERHSSLPLRAGSGSHGGGGGGGGARTNCKTKSEGPQREKLGSFA